MGTTSVAASDETMCMIRTADGERLVTPLGPDLARVAVEHARPIREVISYKQKRSFEGDYWSATLGCLVHHESGLEDATMSAVEAAHGVITVPPFDFPGGRRFHFREPGGNELAAWTRAGERPNWDC